VKKPTCSTTRITVPALGSAAGPATVHSGAKNVARANHAPLRDRAPNRAMWPAPRDDQPASPPSKAPVPDVRSVFEAASETTADITFGKIDNEDQQGLAAAAQITSIPER